MAEYFKEFLEHCRRREAVYKHHKWVRCTKCLGTDLIYLMKALRLRDRRSACCNAPMHPLNWKGFR